MDEYYYPVEAKVLGFSSSFFDVRTSLVCSVYVFPIRFPVFIPGTKP